MKKRIILTALALSIVALAVTPAIVAGPGGHSRHGFAGGHGHSAGGGHGGLALLGHLRHLKEELDLTAPQVEQIKEIVASAHEQNAQYSDQLHGGFTGVAQVLLANPNDIARAQALLDQQEVAERAMKSNLLNATAKALGVLNAEQRAKLSSRLAEHSERRGRGR